MSHPTKGAWIEIVSKTWDYKGDGGRTPRWVRGLKSKKIHAGIKKSKLNAKKRLEWGNIQVFFLLFFSPIIIAQTVIAINNYFTYTQSHYIMIQY